MHLDLPRQELDLLKKNMVAYKEKQKKMFGGMFEKKTEQNK